MTRLNHDWLDDEDWIVVSYSTRQDSYIDENKFDRFVSRKIREIRGQTWQTSMQRHAKHWWRKIYWAAYDIMRTAQPKVIILANRLLRQVKAKIGYFE